MLAQEDYVNSLVIKLNYLKNISMISLSYFFMFYIIRGSLYVSWHSSFLAYFNIVVDNSFLLVFMIVFRPRNVRLFESYYLRRLLISVNVT